MSQAIHPETTAEELAELAQTKPALHGQIANHPNTSPELLIKLFGDYYYEVLANPAIELILLANPAFLSELDDATQCNHFQREPLPSCCYELAINSNEIWYQEAIVRNPHTLIDILEKLLEEKVEVVAAVGLNENCSVEKLETIVRSYSKSQL